MKEKPPKDERHAQQFNGREAETAILFGTSLVKLWRVWWRFPPTSSQPFAASRWQSGNFTLLESNRTIRFGLLATALLKTNNFDGEVLAPFGVKTNLLEGKLGVVKTALREGGVERSAFQ